MAKSPGLTPTTRANVGLLTHVCTVTGNGCSCKMHKEREQWMKRLCMPGKRKNYRQNPIQNDPYRQAFDLGGVWERRSTLLHHLAGPSLFGTSEPAPIHSPSPLPASTKHLKLRDAPTLLPATSIYHERKNRLFFIDLKSLVTYYRQRRFKCPSFVK